MKMLYKKSKRNSDGYYDILGITLTRISCTLTQEIPHINSQDLERQLQSAIESNASFFEELYVEFPYASVLKVSLEERKQADLFHSCLTYGEVSYREYLYVFCQLYRHGLKREIIPSGKFVDIGCGIGRAMFATALVHNFKTVVGIEILGTKCY